MSPLLILAVFVLFSGISASSETQPEQQEETRQAGQDEQRRHRLRLLHRPHQHLRHGARFSGIHLQVGYKHHFLKNDQFSLIFNLFFLTAHLLLYLRLSLLGDLNNTDTV